MGTTVADIMAAVQAVIIGALSIINAILLPTTGLTPVSVFAWFGIVMMAILLTMGFLKKIISLERAARTDNANHQNERMVPMMTPFSLSIFL